MSSKFCRKCLNVALHLSKSRILASSLFYYNLFCGRMEVCCTLFFERTPFGFFFPVYRALIFKNAFFLQPLFMVSTSANVLILVSVPVLIIRSLLFCSQCDPTCSTVTGLFRTWGECGRLLGWYPWHFSKISL